MKRIYRYIKPHLPIMTFQFIIKFGATIVELLLPWMLSTILDDVVPTRNQQMIYLWGILMMISAALALIGNFVANRMSTKTSRDITEKIRHDLFARISRLSSTQTDRYTIPSLISRLTADTYHVHQMIDRMQRLGVRAPILLLGGILVTMSLEPVLTLVLVAMLPLLGLVIGYVSRKGIPLYTQTQTALDAVVRQVQESMTGVRVIKALSKSEFEEQRFDEANRDMIQKEQRARTHMAVSSPAMNLMLNVGLTLVVIVGAYRVNAGVTQPGKIIDFLSYFTIILNALIMVSRLFILYSKGAASARRLAEILDAPEDLVQEDADHQPSDDHVTFKNVRFSYNKVQDDLTDISFSLKRGETLGIIGPTGSGKSTIISLLLRFYDADSGEIRIDGDRILGIPLDTLHTRFGVVFQNDFLLADSIRENIDFGRSLPEEQILRAARTAQADFIKDKAGRLDSTLTVKGANLSGGQKQRLLIARALAANPEILLLDDCSSALDYKTDAALRHGLARDYKDTTTIVVAQRISSIMNADKILVLDEGRTIGFGTHAELLERCDSYREIFDVQMGEMG